MRGEKLQLLALFKPPQADLAYACWRDENQELLAGIPDGAIQVDPRRMDDGTWFRIWVRPEFVPESEEARNTAAQHLLLLIGEISERTFCAGWMAGLEFYLWDAVIGGLLTIKMDDVAIDLLDREDVVDLRQLAGASEGWWVWDDGPRLVGLEEWKAMYRSRRTQ